jgi:hypothetical protein
MVSSIGARRPLRPGRHSAAAEETTALWANRSQRSSPGDTVSREVRAGFDAPAALGDAVKKTGYEFVEQHWTAKGAPLPDEGGNFDIQIAALDEDAQTAAGQRPRRFREFDTLEEAKAFHAGMTNDRRSDGRGL